MSKSNILIFSYGSNNPDQLFNRLDHKIENTYKAKILNTARVFTNSKNSASKGGVATLIQCPGEDVLGFVFSASFEDIEKLNKFEGVPNKYILVKVPVLVHTDTSTLQINVYAYVMSKDFLKTKAIGYVKPSNEYLEKITKTINVHWRRNNGTEFTSSDIPLHNNKIFWGENPEYYPW